MSGDVQPRKRKDKKKKKDDLGIEEPRGTAAALGEGDIFMHSPHEHGTGGHWCAKVIFFSLLTVLITLIGLIILENRGLSELEANSVESRYSGVLEGWLEDAHDDHHDEHTLDLNHHDEEDDDDHSGGLDHGDDIEHDDDDDHDDELEHDDDDEEEQNLDDEDEENDHDEDENQDDDDDEDNVDHEENDDEDSQEANDDGNQNEDSEEQNLETAEEDEVEERNYRSYYQSNQNQADDDDDDDDDDDLQKVDDDNDDDQSAQSDDDDNQEDNDDSQENNDDDDEQDRVNTNDDDENEDSIENDQNEAQENEDEDEHEEHEEEDSDVEVEHIEREVFDDEVSTEASEPEDDKSEEVSDEANTPVDEADEDDVEFLEPGDFDDLPDELPIPLPKGKPLAEVEDSTSTETPQDTLADEEEYERQQEALRLEKEQASQGTGGGNSIEDEWPGEPSDAYWRDEIDQAERDLRQGEWTAASERASAAQLRSSARARYIVARALDSAAEAKRDNALLTKAIAAYLELLKMNERLSDKKLREVSSRALDRIQFRGNYLGAEPVYRLLIRRFPDDPIYRNNLTVSFLMANRVDLAEEVIKETLSRWPYDRIALAHHGFILKTLHNKHEQAVDAFTKALEGDAGPANEPRFYYHLGDSLLLLGRFKEAHEVHKRGAKHGHFLSPTQRSLYNVDRLKSKPWWDVEKTPYTRLVRALEKSWKEILKEGQAAQALYEREKEGLKERGEWSQLDLFVRGREVPNRCSRAPVTCNIVRSEVAASACRRGQVKFSSMEAGTHVRPHVGPTNCRLRMHLGLSNTKDTYIRVDQETRQWQTGKVLMFDDSFEHEVWHNGTGTRLVLIVDVWHPDLTPNEKRQLPAI